MIYTIPSVSSPLQSLIHSSLGIHSLIKRQPLNYNIIDRDKVVVPPNWDSWSKIRLLRDGFDVESIGNGWSLDIEEEEEATQALTNRHFDQATEDAVQPKQPAGAVQAYEEIIRDPSLDALQATNSDSNGHKLEISSLDTQSFLATQVEVLEKIRQTVDTADGIDSGRTTGGRTLAHAELDNGDRDVQGKLNEHIGPVQVNMGGIQVDADNMVQNLRVSVPFTSFYMINQLLLFNYTKEKTCLLLPLIGSPKIRNT